MEGYGEERKNPNGRRSLLNETSEKLVLDAVTAGATLKIAAEAAGVSYDTLKKWIARGEHGHERPAYKEYVEFAQKVRQAQAKGEVGLIARVRKASEENWSAAAWLLERGHSERWGRKQQITVKELSNDQIISLLTQDSDGGGTEEESES